MLDFKVNFPLPFEVKSLVQKADDDYAIAITNSPIQIYLVLKDITKREEIAFMENLTIGVAVIKNIPFIVLDFGNGLSFDVAIKSIEEENDSSVNAINLLLIEKNGYTIKEIRALGLKNELIKRLQDGVKNIPKNVLEKFDDFCHDVYLEYSTEDILHKCEIHKFEKVA